MLSYKLSGDLRLPAELVLDLEAKTKQAAKAPKIALAAQDNYLQ
jgi:hypothetical protein